MAEGAHQGRLLHPMLYGAYRLLRLGLLVDSRGLSGAEPEAPLPIGVLIAHNLAGLLLVGATPNRTPHRLLV